MPRSLDCFLSRRKGKFPFEDFYLIDLNLLQDVRLQRTPARQIGYGSTYHHASVGNGVMKLFQHEANG